MIDRWEEQIAQGLIPDLTEGMLPERRAKAKARLAELEEAEQKHIKAMEDSQLDQFFGTNDISTAPQAFHDDYTKG